MIEAGLVCHWSGLGPSPAWGAASRVSPNPAPLLPRTGGPIPTTPALRRNPRQRRSSALPRALLISLSEREMKAASPAPKVNVHNLSIMIGLPFVPEGPRQFPSVSNAPIAHRRNCRRGYHRSTGQRRTMPARRLMASAGLSTPRLDIREPITRLTERLQSMGGLRHRAQTPWAQAVERASNTCRPMIRTTPAPGRPHRPEQPTGQGGWPIPATGVVTWTVIAHINTADAQRRCQPCATRAYLAWFQSFKYSGAGVGLW